MPQVEKNLIFHVTGLWCLEKSVAPYITVDQILGWFVFLVLDDGVIPFTHLLLWGFEGDCFLVSTFASDCRRIVEQTSNRTAKTLIY
ncbi:MAG: hypothetical protein M1490_05960 [Candidatus Bathyarchaeota archaeon]|nr:hypothetical protein [Candidatus Bathyarchaeota archaeon]